MTTIRSLAFALLALHAAASEACFYLVEYRSQTLEQLRATGREVFAVIGGPEDFNDKDTSFNNHWDPRSAVLYRYALYGSDAPGFDGSVLASAFQQKS